MDEQRARRTMSQERVPAVTFWENFLRAAEVQPQQVKIIQGISGIEHAVLAAGVDPTRRRLIVVSAEQDARTAALMQADLQSAFRGVQVMLARGVASGDPGASEPDRQMGLCAVPFEDFAPDEFETINAGRDVEQIKAVLRGQNILQYFFPPPDQLALGLIERGQINSIPQLIDLLVKTPDLGHPLASTEIMPPRQSFMEIIEELQARQLVSRGAGRFEITDEGRALRSRVRERPREGLISKILNRLSANLNFKSSWLPILRLQRE
ncbi:MAG TPA: hypothetical protein VEQ40_08795 [Pyrinomonadaceae bacterium]|nr:hypothetical protein [Pyrinomonadaceae bacterium]